MTTSLSGDRLLAGGTPEEIVLAYHGRSKHHLHRYARSPGVMDWATQPDPFRRYVGAQLTRLPLPEPAGAPQYWQLYVPGSVAPAPLSIASLSRFLRYALSLTAWKRFGGSTWALRANPSSGNLHPTEGYAVLPPLDGLHATPAVYHYAPREHGLERRADLDLPAWAELMVAFPPASFLVGLSSIHWREAWKYGERAFRYCQHDAGHALAAMRISAAALGWGLSLLSGAGDADVVQALGLDRDPGDGRAEREHPDLLALVTTATPAGVARVARGLPEDALAALTGASWHGEANALTAAPHLEWPVIDEVARATHRGRASRTVEDLSRLPCEEDLFLPPIRSGSLGAESVILGRRSAVSMDGTTSIAAGTFFGMLGRLVPTRDGRSMPWDAVAWRPRIHLGLFVHRVRGLPPGLYALARDPDVVQPLRQAMRREFRWERPATCPAGLHLYLLEEGDCRAIAAQVSCGQDIAADGAFSLGMVADLAACVAVSGAASYRDLFWEAGLVGQVLYLEAEEAGARATGIGCYFDDAVHELFGLSRGWQSLYHFTVGGFVEDVRLTTLPAYGAHAP
jgi:SagB-type dehydrogenase family enzyme